MFAVQVPDDASELPHVLLKISKSPGFVPVRVRLVMVRDDVPLLVSVMTFCAPLPPTGTDAQLNVVGLTDAFPDVVDDPEPVRAIVCGLLVAESVKVRVALRDPAAVGLNTIEAVQDPEADRLVPHVLPVMLKSPGSVPAMATLLIVIEELNPFESVPVCDALLDPT